jgi:plastocyanin
MLMNKLVPVLVSVCLAAPAFAADHQVTQSAKAFSTKSLKAKVGDTVSFRNDDAFVHNIFSLSDTQTFDLGTFAKGETRKVKLEKEGTVEVECAVHPEMKLTVEVAK